MRAAALFGALIVTALSAPAAQASCQGKSKEGVQMARDYQDFGKAALYQYLMIRGRDLPPNPDFTLSHGEEPAAQLISFIVEFLADKSGLRDCLKNPQPIYVVIQKNDHNRLPLGQMRAGVLTLNRAMLDLVETDDELAEIVGHEMLHHTLAHNLQLAKLQNSYWYRAMGIGSSSGDGFGGSGSLSPWDYRNEVLKSRYDSYEREARRATIEILRNANLDPWAIVSLWEKQLRYSAKVDPRQLRSNGTELRAWIEEARGWLTSLRIEPKGKHSTEWIQSLRALLPADR